jgi:hypothetical protein
MKAIGVGLAIFACVTGVVAAIYWYRSSKVPVNPMWPEGAFGPVEPGEHVASQDGWIAGMMESNARAAELNSKAAMWTAGSVLLAAAASIVSVL